MSDMALLKLWRYPVKSMLGEACPSLDIDARGVVGDRLFAVRDADGRFGSGKNTRRFRRIEGLANFQATMGEVGHRVVFPSGEGLAGDDPRIHGALFDALGQTVTLAREAEIAHMDAGPIHIMTTSSLAWIRQQLPGSLIDERRFRPNLLLDTPGVGLLESDWMGHSFRIGKTVVLQVTARTERCGMVCFAQSGLPFDAKVLRAIAQDAELHFGAYVRVVVGGQVKQGDVVARI